MKLSKAIEGYFLDKELIFSPKTVEGYKLFFRYLVEFVGDIEIENVTSLQIKNFLIHLVKERGLSMRSASSAWVVLSSLWTWGEKELQLPHIIRDKVNQPKFTKKAIVIFTADDVKKLIEAAEYTNSYKQKGKTVRNRRGTAARDIAIICTLLDSGLRNSELRSLKIGNYDSKAGRLFVEHGKGDKQRFVVVGQRTRKAIWRYLANRPDAQPDAPLFAAKKTGGQLDENNLRHTLNIIGKRAGVDVYPHKFRHTFAVNFLRNGGNVFVLQELLGHNSLEIVRHYARVAEIDIDAAAKHSVADKWKI